MFTFILVFTTFYLLPLLNLDRDKHYAFSLVFLIIAAFVAPTWLSIFFIVGFISLYFLCYSDYHLTIIEKTLWSFAQKSMPKMNDLEKQALKAGEKSIESVIFSPTPKDVDKAIQDLKNADKRINGEVQRFLDGPVQEVLDLCDDFKINHEQYDLPDIVWKKLKEHKFFGLMITKEYGGLGFDNQAHAQILAKLASKSLTLASIVAVPNSLGPAELLMHYGSSEEKDKYLKRLAAGDEIPCFGLTSTKAGSDAQSIEDHALVVSYEQDGETKIGLKLNFSKRYITLAPVASLIGLAVKLYDPDQLYFEKEDMGITVLLIPASTPGIVRGERHYPSSLVFLNGPLSGQDVIVPIDCILGGAQYAGKGWSMLVECLTCGRAISLPSAALGSAYSGVAQAVLYSRVRQQFSKAIGDFEAVQEPLFEALMWTYALDHMRLGAISLIDAGQKPGVLSGAVKYFATEQSRVVASHVIDVMAGKAVMMGPKNTVLAGYHGAPVGITVEGANILTRGLMVFGQGVLRSHPYLGDIAFAIDEGNSKVFSEKVWDYIASSYFNILALIWSNGKNIFVSREKNVFLAMSTRYRYLCDLLVGYYAGHLKKKGQISGMMAELLSLQFCYLSTLARENNSQTQKSLLSYLAYQFSQQERATVKKLPFILRLAYKSLTWFVPFCAQYPSDRMKEELERFEDRLLNGQLETLDKNHEGLDDLVQTLKQAIALDKDLSLYLKEKQKRPYLTLEQIAEQRSMCEKTVERLKNYLIMLEKVVSVDSFENLKEKKVSQS